LHTRFSCTNSKNSPVTASRLTAASAVRARLRLRPRTSTAIPAEISTRRRSILRQTLLAASAVGPGISAWAVVAEGAVAVAAIGLLSVTARRVALSLI
jgi:hypothetical protein